MQRPKLKSHNVMCSHCTDVHRENECTLRNAGWANGQQYFNTECPNCGTYDSHVDVRDMSDSEIRSKLHDIARQRYQSRKRQLRGNEMVDVECPDCGDTIEVKRRDKPHYQSGDAACDACYRKDSIERLRGCLDPDYDGIFSRAKALMYLKKDYDQMPIVDYDGGLITALKVEYQSWGSGWTVESITKITECKQCGYERAEYNYTANGGHHTIRAFECPKCGESSFSG